MTAPDPASPPGTTWFFRGPAGWLCLLGSVSLALYGGVLASSFAFALPADDPPIPAVVALLGAAYVCYVLALAMVLGRRPLQDDKRLVWLIIGFAVAYRLVLLPSEPIQEIDLYRYLWDGRVLLAGHNPYRYSPAQIDDADLEGTAESMRLKELSRASAAVEEIFGRVHQRPYPTVYPPLAQLVFALVALLTPAAAPVWAHVLVLKTVLVGFDLAVLGTLIGLLRFLQLPQSWSLAYGWCPLVMKEFANSGHLDALAVFLTVAALSCLVRVLPRKGVGSLFGGAAALPDLDRRPAEKTPDPFSLALATAGLGLLGLGVLAKSYPVVLLPVVGAVLIARFRGRALVALVTFAAVVVAGYLPFSNSPAEPAEPQSSSLTAPSNPGTGLKMFLSEWETNDFLFMLLYQNLHAPEEGPSPWFVVVPLEWRQSWRQQLDGQAERLGLSFRVKYFVFVIAQGIMGLILLGLCLWWSWGVYRRPEPLLLLRASFLTLAWGWLLSSAQNPWYLTWALPFMLFAGCRSWFLLPGLALLYYLGFWRDWETHLVWFEHAPFFVALPIEACWRHWRAGSVSDRSE